MLPLELKIWCNSLGLRVFRDGQCFSTDA